MSRYDSSSIGTLFSSLGNSSSNSYSSDLLGINYSDWATIQNGSYRKLVSAYYTKVEGGNGSSSGITDSKQMLTSIKDAAADLKDSASKLLDKGKNSLFTMKTDEKGNSYVDYDTDEVYKAVKSFVNDYNGLVDAMEDADTKSILRSAVNMVNFTSANKEALSEIGITVGADSKLSIDEDKFKSASKARVQSLFQSTGGYAYQISAKAANIGNSAGNAASKVSDTKDSSVSSLKSTSTSKDSTKTLGEIEEAAENAKTALSELRTTGSKSLFNKVTKQDEDGNSITDYDTDAIYKSVNSFIKSYNTLLDKTEDSETQSILQARKTMINYALSYKTSLAAVGITIDSDNNLSVDEEKFRSADMSKVQNLFQGSNTFGAQMEAQIAKIDTYAENEASKANTYSDSGTYSYNYNSGDWYNSTI